MIRSFPTERLFAAAMGAVFLLIAPGAEGKGRPAAKPLTPTVSEAVAFDVSPPMYSLTQQGAPGRTRLTPSAEPIEIRPERGLVAPDQGYSGDGALQGAAGMRISQTALTIPAPLQNFEGVSNQDNFNIFGFRVNPPDPIGDVGPNHYVEMINLVYAVYSKRGNLLVGPVDTGTLWADFPIEDCTDPSGDPIVLYDQLADRWLLSQFTTRGLDDPTLPFYNCVAISQTGDPTGAYYRYAFITQPDPERGRGELLPRLSQVRRVEEEVCADHSRLRLCRPLRHQRLRTREEQDDRRQPKCARGAVLPRLERSVPLQLIGDGLLPADIDGTSNPRKTRPFRSSARRTTTTRTARRSTP